MSLEIKGVVTEILDPKSGTSKAGKEWSKQDFLLETGDGQYPKTICFTCFGDKTDMLENIEAGMTVDVSFNLESREYGGNYFHNVNAWKIIIDAAANPAPAPDKIPDVPEPTSDDSDLPF
jgi:hypothetical protein